MGMGSTHLLIEVELYEIPESHLLVEFGGGLCHCLAFALWQFMMVGPILEGGGAIKVTVVAEGCIRHQPLFIIFEEAFETLALHHLATLLGVECAQILHLGLVHTLVVNLGQGVQLLAQCLELRLQCLVLQGRQLTEVGVLGMERIDADRVIGIGVLPGMGARRVVDG